MNTLVNSNISTVIAISVPKNIFDADFQNIVFLKTHFKCKKLFC